MAPIGPAWLDTEAAVLLQAADAIPPIVSNLLQEGFGGIPGIESLQRQVVCGGPPFVPEAKAQRDLEHSIRPDQEDDGETIDWCALLTRKHPRQALNRGRKWLRKHRIVNDEIPVLPNDKGATGNF
jgi:hypothetical protein